MTIANSDHEAPSLLGIFRHVVEILHGAERSSESEGFGRETISGRPFQIDYEFIASDSHWGNLSNKSTATITDTDGEYLVDVRKREDTTIVLADLPQVTTESVTTEIDRERNEFVIKLEGTTIERISLDGADVTVADSTFKNGVLEVSLQTSETTAEGDDNE